MVNSDTSVFSSSVIVSVGFEDRENDPNLLFHNKSLYVFARVYLFVRVFRCYTPEFCNKSSREKPSFSVGCLF